VTGMADLGANERAFILRQLAAIEQSVDLILIDCAAGISSNVLAFAAAAHTTLIATTPEPTAVTDAYGTAKALMRRRPDARVRLVVNMVETMEEARGVHDRMNRVTQTFLGRSIGFAGAIPTDQQVSAAVRHRLPFVLFAPDAPATQAIDGIARELAGIEVPGATGRRPGFFARVAGWLGNSAPSTVSAQSSHSS
jgi:flagellar biosynthesis protein FlhG